MQEVHGACVAQWRHGLRGVMCAVKLALNARVEA